MDASSESSHWRLRDFGAMLAGLAIVLVYLAASFVFAAALGQLLAGPWAALEQALSGLSRSLSPFPVSLGIRLLVAVPILLVGVRFASRFPPRSVARSFILLPVFAIAIGIGNTGAGPLPSAPQGWAWWVFGVGLSAVLLLVGARVVMRAEGVGWRRS
jgi:hypothetical protein